MRKVRLIGDVRYFERSGRGSLLANTGKIIVKGKVINVGDPVIMCYNHGDYWFVPCEFLGNHGFLLSSETAGSLTQRGIVKPIVYVSHAKDWDFHTWLYGPIHESELNKKLEIVLPHESGDKPFATKEFLESCSAIVAEVSIGATGQGIELGQASMFEEPVPIICIYKKGTKPAGSLRTISNIFYEYDDSRDMINKITQALTQLGLL